MKLKVTQPKMQGWSAQIEIDGEPTTDVTDLTIRINPKGFSTVTMTRILTDVEFDGEFRQEDSQEDSPGASVASLAWGITEPDAPFA